MHAPGKRRAAAPIESLRVGAFRIPTEVPESDGTLDWNATTLVVAEVAADSQKGMGYTYADAGVARIISDHLNELLLGHDAMEVELLWHAMIAALRNFGRQGSTAAAVSAVDAALWDLKARHLDLPLVQLLGPVRESLPLYGSGGFTSYSRKRLQDQFRRWARQGFRRFKMKVGRHPERDPERVRAASLAIGPGAELLVDANSAYSRREALEFGCLFANEFNVRWLEQPLPPQDLAGLKFLRERVPPKLEITDGEYGYDLAYFRRLLEANAVDVVMADATRCGGFTGFRKVATLCETWTLPLSSHCAPALHTHIGCATPPLRHAEYFHDHALIEHKLFDGAGQPRDGALRPDLSRPGLGLDFKWADAEPYAV